MLKKASLAAVVALTLSTSEIVALPIGNPLDATWLCNGIFWEGNCDSDPCDSCITWCDAWSFRVGYYGDFVFDRRLEVDSSVQDSNIRNTEIFTNAGFLALNVWDRVDVFATVGSTKFYIDTPAGIFYFSGGLINPEMNLATETNFSWSIGARGTIWECGCFGIGAEFQYFRARPRINYMQVSGTNVFYFDGPRFNYHEYQFGIGATYAIPIAGCGTFVVPYVGVKWARAKADLGDALATVTTVITGTPTATTFQFHDLENRYSTGVAVGLTLVGCRWWDITAEVRYADELAVHVNSQVRF